MTNSVSESLLRICSAGALACACLYAGTVTAEPADAVPGLNLWGTAGERNSFTGTQGPSLLRPPASWSWDGPSPQLDGAAGLGHRFVSGLNLDLGMSVAHIPERSSINYHDYFFGLSYGALDGKVWYLPETALNEESSLYYEAGWQQPITPKLALSLRVGQFSSGYTQYGEPAELPSLSLGASTDVGGYGFGLRLVDQRGSLFGGEQDLRLMGSISKPLR
ncbi:MAG: hypothetical protein WCZ87_08870 [Thiohalobacteraceae bacterium]